MSGKEVIGIQEGKVGEIRGNEGMKSTRHKGKLGRRRR